MVVKMWWWGSFLVFLIIISVVMSVRAVVTEWELHCIPDEDVRFILCAPNLGAAALVPLPLPADNGFTFVVGGGAAMAAQGSSSSTAPLVLTFNDFEAIFGVGTAIEPHKSSSSSFVDTAFTVLFDLKLVA